MNVGKLVMSLNVRIVQWGPSRRILRVDVQGQHNRSMIVFFVLVREQDGKRDNNGDDDRDDDRHRYANKPFALVDRFLRLLRPWFCFDRRFG